jgi:hypothetical protein
MMKRESLKASLYIKELIVKNSTKLKIYRKIEDL